MTQADANSIANPAADNYIVKFLASSDANFAVSD